MRYELLRGCRYRTFTIVNACNFTVWPATRSNMPVAHGGFELVAGAHVNVSVPDGWIGNWSPRTGCIFNAAGLGSCEVGDCGGRLACDGDANTMPSDHTVVRTLLRELLLGETTLNHNCLCAQAEFNLDSWGGEDFYDQILAFYNLAVHVQPSDPACAAAGCRSDLKAHCEITPMDGRMLSPSGKLVSATMSLTACKIVFTESIGMWLPAAGWLQECMRSLRRHRALHVCDSLLSAPKAHMPSRRIHLPK